MKKEIRLLKEKNPWVISKITETNSNRCQALKDEYIFILFLNLALDFFIISMYLSIHFYVFQYY